MGEVGRSEPDNKFFMSVAFLAARRSKDGNTIVGACIVNERDQIVGVGYNGMPDGVRHNDELFPWDKEKKHGHVCHAEMNAIFSSYSTDLRKCRIYVSMYPCNECTKLIIMCGIKKVFYAIKAENFYNKLKYTVCHKMFEENSVHLVELSLNENLPITFIHEKKNTKEGIIYWKYYYMGVAYLAKDIKSRSRTGRKSGACLVNKDKRIVGVGYRNYCDIENLRMRSYLYAYHAEISAILNSNSVDLKDCVLYTTTYPCKDCAKVIAQKRIKKIIYNEENEDSEEAKAAERTFFLSDIRVKRFKPKYNISIDCTTVKAFPRPENLGQAST